jgi:hypothetical protein
LGIRDVECEVGKKPGMDAYVFLPEVNGIKWLKRTAVTEWNFDP